MRSRPRPGPRRRWPLPRWPVRDQQLLRDRLADRVLVLGHRQARGRPDQLVVGAPPGYRGHPQHTLGRVGEAFDPAQQQRRQAFGKDLLVVAADTSEGLTSRPRSFELSMETGMEKVVLTDAEWRDRLAPEEYQVLRQAGTEAPWTGEYTDTKTVGVYRCRACGSELFRSAEKFESHCGWPSFYQPSSDDAVVLIQDRTLGMARTEARCARCDSHLGHVFEGEGYDVPTDQRWCINSVSLTLEPADS